MGYKRLLALYPRIGNLADLIRVELLPLLAMELLVKLHNVEWVYEINESVANVASVLQIDRQVKEIVFIFMVGVHFG